MGRRTKDRLRINEFRICSFPGCSFKGRYKGFCYNHYQSAHGKNVDYVTFLKMNGILNPQGDRKDLAATPLASADIVNFDACGNRKNRRKGDLIIEECESI